MVKKSKKVVEEEVVNGSLNEVDVNAEPLKGDGS